jgi:hypothetical protein
MSCLRLAVGHVLPTIFHSPPREMACDWPNHGCGRIVTRAFDVNFTCRYFSVSQLEIKVYDRLGREEDQGTEIPDGRWQVYLVWDK